jgi:RimJ/RimL family protein N-acetyltransferase
LNFDLQTERLRLRPCRSEDEKSIHALWTNEKIRHFLFDERVIAASETQSFIEASLSSFARHGYGLWLVHQRESKLLVGFSGFLDPGNCPTLIYGIHPDFDGRGYATEAAACVLRYAVENLGLSEIKADVDEPNLASIRVLRKLNFKQVDSALVNGRQLLYFQLDLDALP